MRFHILHPFGNNFLENPEIQILVLFLTHEVRWIQDRGPTDGDTVTGSSSLHSEVSRTRNKWGPHRSRRKEGKLVGSDFAAMALLSSIASAATHRVVVAPCISRPWRHCNLGSCAAPGVIRTSEKSFAGICRVLNIDNEPITPEEFALGPPVEIARPAERQLWLPGSTPPAYLDGT